MAPGEDSELCLVLHMAGWQWWYEPRLVLQHFLPAGRLTWSYLRRLHRGFGAAAVWLDIYEAPDADRRGRFIKNVWLRSFATVTWSLLRHRTKLVKSLFCPLDGDREALAIESQTGCWRALWAARSSYTAGIEKIRTAQWRKRGSEDKLKTQ